MIASVTCRSAVVSTCKSKPTGVISHCASMEYVDAGTQTGPPCDPSSGALDRPPRDEPYPDWAKDIWERLNGRDQSQEERDYNRNWFESRHQNQDCVAKHRANPSYERPRERRVEGDPTAPPGSSRSEPRILCDKQVLAPLRPPGDLEGPGFEYRTENCGHNEPTVGLWGLR